MGVLKFQLTPSDLASRVPELRKAYVTGLDRTPSRLGIEFRHGLMLCYRDTNESGRLYVPWAVEGFGTPIIGSATLAERPEPYPLAVELRGAGSTSCGTSSPTGNKWACAFPPNSKASWRRPTTPSSRR